ncbi:hypothetical protein PVK06_034482 [Gossypium arboreum]|uniref:Protein FAR1-RELATED SEQUENCE n=1 Tax=Gossypium arboreum TaxID=29729 RepID=A0ABR0NGF1_GOSAR|nr:hypothetical protein PVK06_034482 [Gossypium arboreum]
MTKLSGRGRRCVVENMTSFDFICLLDYILQVGYFDAKKGSATSQQMEAGHVFFEDIKDAMVANRWMARRFRTLHYPCAHVVATSAKVNFNVEQFFDNVYTLERTLHVWENKFPVLPVLSTWEVPLTAFELVLDRGLHRNPRGRPQSSKIRNEMDIREKFDSKSCGLCRLAGHNRSKCP